MVKVYQPLRDNVLICGFIEVLLYQVTTHRNDPEMLYSCSRYLGSKSLRLLWDLWNKNVGGKLVCPQLQSQLLSLTEPNQRAFELNRIFLLFWPQMRSRHVDPGSTSVATGGVSQPGGCVTARTTVEMVPMNCPPPAVSTVSFQSHVNVTTTTRSNHLFFLCVCVFLFFTHSGKDLWSGRVQLRRPPQPVCASLVALRRQGRLWEWSWREELW